MCKELPGDVSSEPGRGVTVCKELPGDVSSEPVCAGRGVTVCKELNGDELSEHQSARAEMWQWRSGVNYVLGGVVDQGGIILSREGCGIPRDGVTWRCGSQSRNLKWITLEQRSCYHCSCSTDTCRVVFD